MIRKSILFIFFLQISFLSLFGQNSALISYSSHAMHEGDVVVLRELDTISVGTAGINKIWDFSKVNTNDIQVIKYNLNENESTLNAKSFVCDIDNGQRTSYYTISQFQKSYVGFSTPSGKIIFDEPMVELNFPFQYNSTINGKMDGKFTSNAGESDNITGTYSVLGDATGTLILPNGVTLKNVLRVKYVQDYYQPFSGTLFHIIVTRYLFYSSNYRYPVLQVKDAKIDCDCGCKSKEYSAYYNESVTSNKEEKEDKACPKFTYEIYPNPFEDLLKIDYSIQSDAKIKIRLLDMRGKEVKVLVNSKQEQGAYSVEMNLSGAHHGSTYIVELKVNDIVYSEKVMRK